MDTVLAEKLIDSGLAKGADFVEIYEEESRGSTVSWRDQKVEAAQAGTDFGIGIRLLYGTDMKYGFSSKDDEDSLIKLIHLLAARDQGSTTNKTPFRAKELVSTKCQVHPASRDQSYKKDLLEKVDQVARSTDSRVVQVGASAYNQTKRVQVFNSEGLFIEEERVRCRFMLSVTAASGEERFRAGESPGVSGGIDFFETLDLDKLATTAASRACLMLDAGYIEGKKMPVVLGNGFGGVIFHEACGHPLETEAVRRNASPFAGKIGEPIAQECLTAIDDGTIDGSWGSLHYDDEGMPTQKTTLIENGILKTFLADRIGAAEVGVPRSGSARRESYAYAPVSRMRNTFIAAGNSSLTDMLTAAEGGLYAKKMGGGSVNPATGEFNFAVEEGYRIKNGKLAEPVRGATLIGKGHEIMKEISMVGNDLEIAAGMCGASSGWVPVTVGQPTILVDSILVGGR